MLHILGGEGAIEVDFHSFDNWEGKIIFMEKGQYIKFLNVGFVVRKIPFKDQDVFKNKNFRVLFKHLVSLGYINFKDCIDCQTYLSNSIMTNPYEILDVSSKQWYWQNPFKAKSEEYHIIFDVKDIIDEEYRCNLSSEKVVKLLKPYGMRAQELFNQKVGISIHQMILQKRRTEARKQIGFTLKSIKEIAYEFGYNDPAYFNREFKNRTGYSPLQYRNKMSESGLDPFVEKLNELILKHHADERAIPFYADKMNISIKTISQKVKQKMHTTLGHLIRQTMINSAKDLLSDGASILEVSEYLNFNEQNHFSSFFKNYTGITPSDFINLK